VVLTKTYDLLLWYVQQIGRFPRQHRYSLVGGERIKKHLFRVMEWLTIARPQGENRRQLQKVNLRLEVLRIQTWFAKDLQCLKCKSCGFAVQWTHGDTRPQARATA